MGQEDADLGVEDHTDSMMTRFVGQTQFNILD